MKITAKITVLILLFLMLGATFIPIFSQNSHQSVISSIKQNESELTPAENPDNMGSFLQLDTIRSSCYGFKARGPVIIGIDLIDVDFSFFLMDGSKYDLSYGSNIIYHDFGENEEIHNLILQDSTDIEKIFIQPVIIFNSSRQVNISQTSEINFDAGGIISILVRPNFHMDYLYLKVDDIILKHNLEEEDPSIFNQTEDSYPYQIFPIQVDPGNHSLIIRGNGLIDILIVSDYDYDEDGLKTSEEIYYCEDYGFDPLKPDLWGYFDSSYKEGYFAVNIDAQLNIFIPYSSGTSESFYLFMDLYQGMVSDLQIDDDKESFKNIIFSTNLEEPIFLKGLTPGFHQIFYKISGDYYNVNFRIGVESIPIVLFTDLLDNDGDGVKDIIEVQNGLNPFNPDSDLDLIPDFFDASPSSTLILEKDEIGQIIIPINTNTTSILSFQVKPPEINYYSEKRRWRDDIDVSIIPAIRIFGSPIMSLSDLKDYYKLNITTYNLYGSTYNPKGLGDFIPNPTNSSAIFTTIPLRLSNNSWGVDITYEPLHPAKTDYVLDFRFNFVWMVIDISNVSASNILHYYPIEEPLTIQSLILEEISNLTYIFAHPDSYAENVVFNALIENPLLGEQSLSLNDSFNYFDVLDEVIGFGSGSYNELFNQILLDRQHKPLNQGETEVLYIRGSIKNEDILNLINLKMQINPSEIEKIQGKWKSTFILNTVSNTLEESKLKLLESGNFRIVETEYEPVSYVSDKIRKIIFDEIIDLKVIKFPNSLNKILILTKVYGGPIDSKNIYAQNENNLNPKLKLKHEIIIDKYDGETPSYLKEGIGDVRKTFYNNRQDIIDLDNLSRTPTSFLSAFARYQIASQNVLASWQTINMYAVDFNNLRIRLNIKVPNSALLDPKMIENSLKIAQKGFEMGPGSLNSRDYFKMQKPSCEIDAALTEINRDPKLFDKMTPEEKVVYREMSKSVKSIDYNNFYEMTQADNGYRIPRDMELISNPEDPTEIAYRESYIRGEAYDLRVKINLKEATMGTITIVFGAIIFITGLLDAINLIKARLEGTNQDILTTFALRLGKAFSLVAMGSVLVFMGAIQLAYSFTKLGYDLFTKYTNFLTKITFVLTAFIIAIDFFTLVSEAVSGEISDLELVYAFIEFAINTAFTLLPIILMLAGVISSTGYGALLGLIIAGLAFLGSWLTTQVNHPNYNITNSKFIFPEAQCIRDGSLTQGHSVSLNLTIRNTGDRPIKFRARTQIGGITPKADQWGPWQESETILATDYFPGIPDPHPFGYAYRESNVLLTDIIDEPSKEIYYHIQYAAEAEIIEFVVMIPIPEWTPISEGTIPPNRMGFPALESNISTFYTHTIPLSPEVTSTTSRSIQDYEEALSEYRYRDAFQILKNIIDYSESNAKIKMEAYDTITSRLEFFNATHNRIQAINEPEFHTLLSQFFNNGWRATSPKSINLTQIPSYLLSEAELRANLDGYMDSNGHIYVPEEWVLTTGEKLEPARVAQQNLNMLPLKSNIRLDNRQPIAFEHNVNSIYVPITFQVDGPDNPVVEKLFGCPEGFRLSTSSTTTPLSTTFYLTISRTDPNLLAGIYFLNVTIKLGGKIIYDGIYLIRLKSFQKLVFIERLAPIDPGSTATVLSVVNQGNVPEILSFGMDHIPPEFMPTFLNNPLIIQPGHLEELLQVSPPRLSTVNPGRYNYTLIRYELGTQNELARTYWSFYIDEFHDLTMQIMNTTINRPGYSSGLQVNLGHYGNAPDCLHFKLAIERFDPILIQTPTTTAFDKVDSQSIILEIYVERYPLLAPNNYPLYVEVLDSCNNRANSISTITILDFHDFNYTYTNPTITDAGANYTVQVKNLGNVQDVFNFSLEYLGTNFVEISLKTPTLLLSPAAEANLTIFLNPYDLGFENFSISGVFYDHHPTLISKVINANVRIIDDDPYPPNVIIKYLDDFSDDFYYHYQYYQSHRYSYRQLLGPNTEFDLAENDFRNIIDGYYIEHAEYQKFWYLMYDQSGFDQINMNIDNTPVYPTLSYKPRLIYPLSTQNQKEFLYMGGYGVNIKRELVYASDEESHAGYLALSSFQFQYPRIQSVDVELDGQVWAPSSFETTGYGQTLNARYPIPRDPGVHTFRIHIQYIHFVEPFIFNYVAYHTVYIANSTAGVIQIPLRSDNSSTPLINEGLHNFSISVRDNDCDNGREYDKLVTNKSWSVQILDDDTSPPEIQITASDFDPNVLLQGVLDLNMTESWRVITDQLAQYGFSRWVSWNLKDTSGFSQTQVTYEIEGFDGTILFPERVIFNETESGSPYLMNLVGTFICSLIPGYHHFRVSCSDGDTDWEGDTLSSYKEYVFTISDDDESPLELQNLTLNSEISIDAVPMIEVTARITEPAFARNPALFQFLVFVDDQWIPNVSVSYEWFYNDSMSPAIFQEALVKFRFENTWAEGELLGNHTVEILTVDDDYDVLSMDPNPFAQYLGQNYETYRFLHMAENLSFYSPFQGFYSEPLPYSFAGYFFNQSIYYSELMPWFHPLIILTPYLINLFGFPVLNFTILDTNGDVYGRGQGFSPIFSAIIPSFYAAAQLFFILLHNGVLESYDMPWSRFNTSSVALSRGTMEILLQDYGPTELIDQLSFTVPAGSFQVLGSFDGLLLNYLYAQVAGSGSQTGTYNVSYTQVEGSNFSVYAISDAFQSDQMFEDAQSRVITRSTLFPPNTHTPIWIFPNASLGETVPIGVDGEGDHLFNISRLQQYCISKNQRINAWVLEDLTMLEGIAYYEAATGILLEGTFRSANGFYYTLKLLDSNLEYIPPPILNTYAPTLSGTLSPESGDQLQSYSFSVEYVDLDNNAPAYVEMLIDGIPYLMRKQDPSDNMYLDGSVYQLGAHLSPGFHNYSFRCSDGEFITTTPTFFGPEVVAKFLPPRETLVFTIYPELLIGTPTLFHTLENGTTIFMPTERLTFTYDLATGIVLHIILEHIANPTDPVDQNLTNLEFILEDTNLLLPYEFLYHNQILPRFIPADAALQSFFTSFEVLPRYEMTGSVVPLTCTVFDNESAQWVLNITNIGNIADSYQLSVQNLTLGSATFSHNPIDLLPQASALVTLQVGPLQLGTESFAVLIESLGTPAVNLTLSLQLRILDDDALPPTLALEYIGDYTDANLGFIHVEAQDSSGLALDPSGDYAVSFSFEPQTFEFVALDNDSDRPGDQLGQNASITLTLYDDDTTAPLVTNLSATLLESVLLLQFMASDASGIGAVAVTVNGTPVLPLAQSVNGSSYTLTFANLWIDEGGTYLMELQVTDADCDRPADALTTVLQTTFLSAPDLIKSLMLTGLDQLSTLEGTITTINCSLVRWFLSGVVNRAAYNLETALSLYLAGNTTQASLRVWIAKCQMCVSEFIVKIADWLNVLEEDLAVTLLGQIASIQQTLTQILALL